MTQLTTEDRLAIQETLSRYCHCLDRGRWEELVSLFTEDCRLDLSQVLGSYEGHAGLRQFAQIITSANLFMRHLVTNTVIDGDGAKAHAQAYVIAITGPQGTKPQQTTGLYVDELVKRDGRWLLHRRHLTLDMPA